MKKIMSAILSVAMMFSLVIIPTGAYTHDPSGNSQVVTDGCSHDYQEGVCTKCGKINMKDFWVLKGSNSSSDENSVDVDGDSDWWVTNDRDNSGVKDHFRTFNHGFVMEYDLQVVATINDHGKEGDYRWGVGLGFGDAYYGGIGFIYDTMTGTSGNWVIRSAKGDYKGISTDAINQYNPKFGDNVVTPVPGELSRKTWYHFKVVYDAETGYIAMYVDGDLKIEATDSRLITKIGGYGVLLAAYDQHQEMKNAYIYDYEEHDYVNGVCSFCGKVDLDAFWTGKSGNTTATETLLDADGSAVTSNENVSYAAGFNADYFTKMVGGTTYTLKFGKDGSKSLNWVYDNASANTGKFVLKNGSDVVATSDSKTLNRNAWYDIKIDYNAESGYLALSVDGASVLSGKYEKLADTEGSQLAMEADGQSYMKDASFAPYVCPHSDWVEPTCTEAGHCNVCAATRPALGHDFSCGECKICHTQDPENPDAEHEWLEATCVSPKMCSVCGITEGEVNPDHHVYADATCKAPKTCIYRCV